MRQMVDGEYDELFDTDALREAAGTGNVTINEDKDYIEVVLDPKTWGERVPTGRSLSSF